MNEWIAEIGHKEAKGFIEKWHYSRCCPTGKNMFFGWFVYLPNNKCEPLSRMPSLYAVADYGIGVNPYQAQSLQKLTGIEVVNSQLLELKRLCRIEPRVDQLPLTKFLSKCQRHLRSQGFRFIVSFSDPEHSHNGGIYRAANFSYLGKTNAETHAMDLDGNVRHRRYYFRYARRNNVSVEKAREALGLTLIKTQPKDRWFIKL